MIKFTMLLVCAVIIVGILAWKLCQVAPPTMPPRLATTWHEQLYGLDEHEALRFISPPYSPHRMQIMARGYYKNPMPGVMGQLAFYSNRGSQYPFGISSKPGTLADAVSWSTIGHEREIDTSLQAVSIDGDWFIRETRPVEPNIDRRMQALQSVLRQVTGKEILIEKRPAERDVILVAGRWEFKPLQPSNQYLPNEVCLYVTDGDQRGGAQDTHRGDLDAFLWDIHIWTNSIVVDESEGPRPQSIEWALCLWRTQATESPATMDQFLSNVQKQTSLRFTKAKRPVPVWFVSERPASTQPRGKP